MRVRQWERENERETDRVREKKLLKEKEREREKKENRYRRVIMDWKNREARDRARQLENWETMRERSREKREVLVYVSILQLFSQIHLHNPIKEQCLDAEKHMKCLLYTHKVSNNYWTFNQKIVIPTQTKK